MDPSTRQRRQDACVKNQSYAAAAHELAACALEVASSASEGGKQLWLQAAFSAQETAALEATAACDQLLNLLNIGRDSLDNGGAYANDRETTADACGEVEKSVEKQTQWPDRGEWWIRAIVHLARFRAGKVMRRNPKREPEP